MSKKSKTDEPYDDDAHYDMDSAIKDKKETDAIKKLDVKKARRRMLEKIAATNPASQDFGARLNRIEAILELSR